MFSKELISSLKSAKRVAVLTGAGVSAESGVPTFRGEDGIWKKLKPEELANFDAFMRNPDMVWEWYAYRKKLMSEVRPNLGHFALVKMEEFFPQFTLITQNIDNLHRCAGSKNILELHGNIRRNYCIKCHQNYEDAELNFTGTAPKCSCGGLIRPDVVWFGEMLPQMVLEAAFAAAESAEIFFSIGTSAVVYPAAMLPISAKRAGAILMEVNPERTVLTNSADYFLCGASGVVLSELVKELTLDIGH
jgi:NAD-dependent deacetylase